LILNKNHIEKQVLSSISYTAKETTWGDVMDFLSWEVHSLLSESRDLSGNRREFLARHLLNGSTSSYGFSFSVFRRAEERERARLRLKPNTSCPRANLKSSEVTCLLKE